MNPDVSDRQVRLAAKLTNSGLQPMNGRPMPTLHKIARVEIIFPLSTISDPKQLREYQREHIGVAGLATDHKFMFELDWTIPMPITATDGAVEARSSL